MFSRTTGKPFTETNTEQTLSSLVEQHFEWKPVSHDSDIIYRNKLQSPVQQHFDYEGNRGSALDTAMVKTQIQTKLMNTGIGMEAHAAKWVSG